MHSGFALKGIGRHRHKKVTGLSSNPHLRVVFVQDRTPEPGIGMPPLTVSSSFLSVLGFLLGSLLTSLYLSVLLLYLSWLLSVTEKKKSVIANLLDFSLVFLLNYKGTEVYLFYCYLTGTIR